MYCYAISLPMKSARPISSGTFHRTALVLFLLVGGGMALHAQNATPSGTDTASTDASVPPSLVSNGNFELATADPTWPDNWMRGKGISWETENGKHFLRLVQQTPGTMLMAYREIDIPAGTKALDISIKYRASGVVAGAQPWLDARAIFHFIDADRKQLSPDPGALIFAKDIADWTTLTEHTAVPDGATKMMLMPCLFQAQAGTLDLAEVRVTVSP